MYATIKTRAAFRTAYLRDAVDYNLTPDALDSVSSTLSLLGGDIPSSARGSFVLLDGVVYLISQVSPGAGLTALQLSSPLELFSRPQYYVPPGVGVSVGDFIARELAADYRDEPDAAYAMPYLEIESTDRTPFVAPEVDANGLYVLTDYLRTVRRSLGVETAFFAQGDKLLCTIRKTAPGQHTLICGDGSTFLESNSYSRTAVAKVSTYQPVDTGEVDDNGEKIFQTVRTDWFLAADGSVSSQEPAGRALGEWETVTVSEKNDAQEAAEAVFAKNAETHKVEFWTGSRLRVRDDMPLRLPSGEVFSGSVTAVSRRKGDRRWLNQAGTLATTLTDKVRRASSRSGTGSGRSRAASGTVEVYAVGDIYVTTREGDPAQLLGYGAWDRIRGRVLFAADATHPVGSRFGAANHTITAEELPADASVLDAAQLYIRSQGAASGSSQFTVISNTSDLQTKAMGAGQSFSLFPPTIALYVWVRKA